MANSADVLKNINKKLNHQAVKMGTDYYGCQRIPTGVFEIDYIMGGGVPRGKVSIFYGFESSNKTNLALLTAKNDLLLSAHLPNAKKKKWLLIDIENSYDKIWTQRLGVPVDQLIVYKPDYAEQAIDVIDAFLDAEDLEGVIIDSVAIMTPEAEAENSAERVQVGGNALLVTKMMRLITRKLIRVQEMGRYPTVICINQIRHKIGVNFGNPETMAGGNALRFQSGLSLRLNGTDKIIKNVDPNMACAKTTTAIIKKAKVPYLAKSTEFDLAMRNFDRYLIGDSMDDNFLLTQLKDLGWMTRSGTGWEFSGAKFKNQQEVIDSLHADLDYLGVLKTAIIKTRMEQLHGEDAWVDYQKPYTE
ncbi:RecA [Vibrio phage vB_ValS_VA-RY-4]|nr:RecA [Vibrio phage vB_ValS_VA-RY-4]